MASREFPISNYVPQGLQSYLTHREKVSHRFFICDDSGSMTWDGGRRLIGTGRDLSIMSCSRWDEMLESISYHSAFSNSLDSPSEFRFLNRSQSHSTTNSVLIGGPNAHPNGLLDLKKLCDEGLPDGGTPLCRHIREVVKIIQDYGIYTRETNDDDNYDDDDNDNYKKHACIIIATDGVPSDGEVEDLVEVMKQLQNLRVFVVIKLCTDESDLVEFWDKVDKKLTLKIEVLDDLLNESQKVYECNPWLNYNEMIQRMREFGMNIKGFDLLDERKLTFKELHKFCNTLYGVELPNPKEDFNNFISLIGKYNLENPFYYSFIHKKMMSLINIDELKKCYDPTRF